MRYECGHDGCDICGERRCEGVTLLRRIGHIDVCEICIRRAVEFTYSVACKFGGTVIDVNKRCARPGRKSTAKGDE